MTGIPELPDCQESVDRLYEYLDGELTPAADAEIRMHLEACAHCLALFDFETAYVRFLQARTRAAGAPAHLKERILQDLLFHDDPSTTP